MANILTFPSPKAADMPQSEAKAAPARYSRKTEKEERRKHMLAKVHVAKKQLGLKDEEYRAILDGQYGVESAKELSVPQLHGLLIYFSRLGFTPKRGSAKRGAKRNWKTTPALLAGDHTDLDRDGLMSKIEALLAEKGRVEGTHVPWGYATAILKRQTGNVIRCFEHAQPEQLRDVMLALMRDAKRKGRMLK